MTGKTSGPLLLLLKLKRKSDFAGVAVGGVTLGAGSEGHGVSYLHFAGEGVHHVRIHLKIDPFPPIISSFLV